jgi:hypothetical protein
LAVFIQPFTYFFIEWIGFGDLAGGSIGAGLIAIFFAA